MKLSFSSLPCEGWSVERLIDGCRRHGFEGIELKVCEGYAITPESSDEEIKSAAARFREAGIVVTNIGSSVTLNGIGDESAQLSAISRHLRIAALLGARGVRIFPGSFFKKIEERNRAHNIDRLVNRIQEACDEALAHGAGVELWIETHNEFSTGNVLGELLARVGRRNCRVIYDILHPLEFGERPEETIGRLDGAIAHVHIKDGVPNADPELHDWTYTKIGDGLLPLAQIIDLLRRQGYDGYYSLEWETKWRPELRAAKLELDDVFADYVGLQRELWPAARKGDESDENAFGH